MAKKTVDMLGVTFSPLSDETGGPCVDADSSMYYLPYDKNEEYFSIYENEVHFYKGVEDLVRKHPFYRSKLMKYLVEVVGVKTCQVFSNIEIPDNPKSKVQFEMHHGPILTLFDIVQIVTTYYRKKEYPHITTCFIANVVVEEHRLNNVRLVVMTKTAHQQVTEGNVFLNYNMGFGNTEAFLEKYKEGVTDAMAQKINKYIEASIEHDSYDNDVFRIAEQFKRWGNNDFDSFGPSEEGE